jgi:hypothetical protein
MGHSSTEMLFRVYDGSRAADEQAEWQSNAQKKGRNLIRPLPFLTTPVAK